MLKNIFDSIAAAIGNFYTSINCLRVIVVLTIATPFIIMSHYGYNWGNAILSSLLAINACIIVMVFLEEIYITNESLFLVIMMAILFSLALALLFYNEQIIWVKEYVFPGTEDLVQKYHFLKQHPEWVIVDSIPVK